MSINQTLIFPQNVIQYPPPTMYINPPEQTFDLSCRVFFNPYFDGTNQPFIPTPQHRISQISVNIWWNDDEAIDTVFDNRYPIFKNKFDVSTKNINPIITINYNLFRIIIPYCILQMSQILHLSQQLNLSQQNINNGQRIMFILIIQASSIKIYILINFMIFLYIYQQILYLKHNYHHHHHHKQHHHHL
eukprot:UN02996